MESGDAELFDWWRTTVEQTFGQAAIHVVKPHEQATYLFADLIKNKRLEPFQLLMGSCNLLQVFKLPHINTLVANARAHGFHELVSLVLEHLGSPLNMQA